MKVLVIGSGGREHALAWRLAQSPSVSKVYAAPGNPGMAEVAEVVPAANSVGTWRDLAKDKNIDVTVVGPEVPLVAGVVDIFRMSNLPIVGPTAEAAKLEGSKSFAKEFMIRAGIPTARHCTVTSQAEARKALDEFGFPVVLKADGLAAGKGVVIARDRAEAEAALPELLVSTLVVEEFLEGEEVSFIVLTDGTKFVPFAPTQDHKAAYDGDKGPNTGGMGAYRDAHILGPSEMMDVITSVIEPTLGLMEAERRIFTGFLYAGLMMTSSGPKVLEFNARLGDPETQPLLHGLTTDLGEVLKAAAHRDLAGHSLAFSGGASVCVVLAAHGYPGQVRTGDTITGIDEAEACGATVFQAGTRIGRNGLETAGGRVLGVTSSALDLRTAMDTAYTAARAIRFDGMQFRTDIGAKGLRRY